MSSTGEATPNSTTESMLVEETTSAENSDKKVVGEEATDEEESATIEEEASAPAEGVTKATTNVVLPPGSIGVMFGGSPPVVKSLKKDSPVAGQVKPGQIVASLVIPDKPELCHMTTTELVDALKSNIKLTTRTLVLKEGGVTSTPTRGRATSVIQQPSAHSPIKKAPRSSSATAKMVSDIKKMSERPKTAAATKTKSERIYESVKSKSTTKFWTPSRQRSNSVSSIPSADAKRIVSSVKKQSVAPKQPHIEAEKQSELSGKVVRKTSFKRIRGILLGSHRSPKKSEENNSPSSMSESQRAELAVAASTIEPDDDGSTVYNVTLDDRSVTASIRGDSSVVDLPKIPEAGECDEKTYLLRMILLLMDIETRRFELLQLEFDSEKALVSDVLNQVHVSVTEGALRSQTYQSVVTAQGEEMTSDKQLADFCHGNEVLVAVPTGLSGEEVARLAKPILLDKKVVGMLKSSGVDAQKWTKTKDYAEPAKEEKTQKAHKDDVGAANWSSHQIPDYGKHEKLEKKLGGSLVFAAIAFAAVAVILNFLDVYISRPIQPGHIVSPGIVLSKCGLLKGWPLIGPKCDRAYLEVNSGIVSYYNGKDLTWVIHGHVCPADEVKEKTCLDGLEFKKDGTVALGGLPIKWLERYTGENPEKPDNHLSPWPFTEEPKIRIWEVASNNISDDAKQAVGKITNDAKNAAGKIVNDAKSVAGKITNDAKNAAGKITNNAKNAAGKITNDAKDAAGKITTDVKNAAWKIADRLKEMSQN